MRKTKKKGYYLEASGRHVYKTTEEYKGIIWECKGTSMKSAETARRSWQKAKERKIAEINGEIDRKVGKTKLKKELTDWYNLYKRHEVRNGRSRSKRTIQTDEDTINQIVNELGNYWVCEITSDILQRYFVDVARKFSISTVRKRWRMLDMFFRFWFLDDENPMNRCTMPVPENYMQRGMGDDIEGIDKRAYTAEEMKCLATELSHPYNHHSGWHTGDRGYSAGALIIVMMYEFLRIAEVVELRVKDVLFDENMIYIRRQYDEYHKIVTLPKYVSQRKVPIMTECRALLEEACHGKNENDLLFTAGNIYNPDKLKHDGRILQGRVRDNLRTACERIGLEQHTPHDLRHDGISRLVDMGVKPQSVSRWAGHKSLTVTLDRYYRHNGQEDNDDMLLVCG